MSVMIFFYKNLSIVSDGAFANMRRSSVAIFLHLCLFGLRYQHKCKKMMQERVFTRSAK